MEQTVAFAFCGSFCSLEQVLPPLRRLVARGMCVIPIMSFCAASTDTRFGTAEEWKCKIFSITGARPLETLQQVEPLGPRRLADALIIAPCTGSTLARLACGLSDTPVTLAAKSLLRSGRPVVLAPSTNDGLGASAANLATLLTRKNIYLVPFGQDECFKKPNSLKSDFSLIPDALDCALAGRQLQPVLLT